LVYPDAYFVDSSELFINYIDSIGFDEIMEIYEEYSSEPKKFFKSELSENDLFTIILDEIEKAGQEQKMPILIRTGALNGTRIENINLMDSKIVQNLPYPPIIMYPATIGCDNKLKFLNFKLTSDYRAIVIY